MCLKNSVLSGVVALSLLGCATIQNSSETSPADSLATLMVGTFKTATSDSDNNFKDRRIRIPALGEGEWVYYQLNTGEEAKLYRQRVIQLLPTQDGRVEQLTYRLKETESFADPWESGKDITKDDLIPGFNDKCTNIWEQESPQVWVSVIDPNDCRIESERRGRTIGISSRSKLSQRALLQAEAGYELDGTFLWGTPEGEYITLERQ